MTRLMSTGKIDQILTNIITQEPQTKVTVEPSLMSPISDQSKIYL